MATVTMTSPVSQPEVGLRHFLDRVTMGGSPSSVNLCFLLQQKPQRKSKGISAKDGAWEKTEGILEKDRDPGEALPVAVADLSLHPSLPPSLGHLPSFHIPALLASPPNSFPFKKK